MISSAVSSKKKVTYSHYRGHEGLWGCELQGSIYSQPRHWGKVQWLTILCHVYPQESHELTLQEDEWTPGPV